MAKIDIAFTTENLNDTLDKNDFVLILENLKLGEVYHLRIAKDKFLNLEPKGNKQTILNAVYHELRAFEEIDETKQPEYLNIFLKDTWLNYVLHTPTFNAVKNIEKFKDTQFEKYPRLNVMYSVIDESKGLTRHLGVTEITSIAEGLTTKKLEVYRGALQNNFITVKGDKLEIVETH